MSTFTTRRRFIKTASLAGAGALLAPGLVSAKANDKVVVAVMGTRSRGLFLAQTNGHKIEGHRRGVVFYGDKGTIVYGGGDSYQVLDGAGKVVKEVKSTAKFDATKTVSPLANLEAVHLVNFVEAIRSNAQLTAPILEGHKSTLLPQLGNIAYRTSRSYEKGWEIKV